MKVFSKIHTNENLVHANVPNATESEQPVNLSQLAETNSQVSRLNISLRDIIQQNQTSTNTSLYDIRQQILQTNQTITDSVESTKKELTKNVVSKILHTTAISAQYTNITNVDENSIVIVSLSKQHTIHIKGSSFFVYFNDGNKIEHHIDNNTLSAHFINDYIVQLVYADKYVNIDIFNGIKSVSTSFTKYDNSSKYIIDISTSIKIGNFTNVFNEYKKLHDLSTNKQLKNAVIYDENTILLHYIDNSIEAILLNSAQFPFTQIFAEAFSISEKYAITSTNIQNRTSIVESASFSSGLIHDEVLYYVKNSKHYCKYNNTEHELQNTLFPVFDAFFDSRTNKYYNSILVEISAASGKHLTISGQSIQSFPQRNIDDIIDNEMMSKIEISSLIDSKQGDFDDTNLTIKVKQQKIEELTNFVILSSYNDTIVKFTNSNVTKKYNDVIAKIDDGYSYQIAYCKLYKYGEHDNILIIPMSYTNIKSIEVYGNKLNTSLESIKISNKKFVPSDKILIVLPDLSYQTQIDTLKTEFNVSIDYITADKLTNDDTLNSNIVVTNAQNILNINNNVFLHSPKNGTIQYNVLTDLLADTVDTSNDEKHFYSIVSTVFKIYKVSRLLRISYEHSLKFLQNNNANLSILQALPGTYEQLFLKGYVTEQDINTLGKNDFVTKQHLYLMGSNAAYVIFQYKAGSIDSAKLTTNAFETRKQYFATSVDENDKLETIGFSKIGQCFTAKLNAAEAFDPTKTTIKKYTSNSAIIYEYGCNNDMKINIYEYPESKKLKIVVDSAFVIYCEHSNNATNEIEIDVSTTNSLLIEFYILPATYRFLTTFKSSLNA